MAEQGYYHPDRGYWQTTGVPPQEILDGYPAGTIEVPVRPSINHQWDGSQWVYVEPTPPTAAELEAEVQAIADDLTAGEERDKAIALTMADMWAVANNITVTEARQAVRDRIVHHLRVERGLA